MSRVIGILSGKGGVGKTTIAINVGAALASHFQKRVLVVDTNVNTPHLGMHAGLNQDLPVTLGEVLNENTPATNAIYVEPLTGVRLITAPLERGKLSFTPAKIRSITRKFARDYDLILLDCSPGLGKEVVTSVSAIDAAIIVTTPDFPSLIDAWKTSNLLERMGKRVIGIVVNKRKGEKYELTRSEIESTCASKVLATVPEDDYVPRGISKGIPVVVLSPNSKASKVFKQLAGVLIGQDYRPTTLIERIVGLFSRRQN